MASLAGGTVTTSATALSEQSDPDTSDNTASETTTVNDVGQSLVVTNTNNSGTDSLRQAINFANADSGPDTITFAIPGPGVHTIEPTSALPAITAPMSMDGGLTVELSGVQQPAGWGLYLATANATVRGLIVNRFPAGGLQIAGGGMNHIEGNYIGLNGAGLAAVGSMPVGVRPSIALASSPTASTRFVVLSTATTEGSLRTMPCPAT